MSTEADHICEERKREKDFRDVKGFHQHNSRNRLLFTCGGCGTKFRTVCRLHVHLEDHQEGGSYIYDHVTKTAFPKYDSVCACTQVEQNVYVLIAQNAKRYEEKDSSIKETSEKDTESQCEAARRSKRIALRHNKNQEKAKIKETKIETNEFDVKKTLEKNADKTQNASSAESEIITTKLLKTLDKQKRKKIVNRTDNKAQCKKRKTTVREESPEALLHNDSELSKTHEGVENLKFVSDGVTKIENIVKDTVPIDQVIRVRLDDFKIVEQKTDEIAASEALIAISKSVDGESLKNVSDTTFGGTEVNIHLSRPCDSFGNNGANLSNAEETTVDIEEQNVNGDSDKQNKNLNECLQTVRKDKSSKMPYTVLGVGGQENLETQIAEIHTSKSQEQLKPVVKIEKSECPVCGKRGTRAMLSYHRYLHKEDKELSCDKCGKQFKHPSCLKVHLRSHEENVYNCEMCLAKFSRKKYLETHMLKHSGEKPYMCETCGKSYRDEMHLKRHIKHVHEQIRKFECDICKERFFRTDHLKCHRMRHFEPGLRCSLCHKKFKLPVDLERHMIVHTGEKNWYCHLCDHGFRYPVPYYNHMKKKHDIERKEAGMWRKKMIEENKRHKEYSRVTVGMKEENYSRQSDLNTEKQSESRVSVVDYSEVSNIGMVEVSTEVSTFNNMYVKQDLRGSRNSVDTTEPGTAEQAAPKDSVSTSDTAEIAPGLLANAKEYRLFRVSNLTSNKVLQNFAPETVSSGQGVHFPLQDAYSEAEDAGTGADGIVGFEEGNHLQDDEMVVMGEETVTEEIGVITDIEGENIQAVMFIADNECAGEVVIDQETTI